MNCILTNVEVWYNLTPNEIIELEDLDKVFLRKVLDVPGSTHSEAFYSELGILPTIIKARSLNYLQIILTGDRKGMLYSFCITQWHNPTKFKDTFKRIVKTKAK
jgi:hypothetical protein